MNRPQGFRRPGPWLALSLVLARTWAWGAEPQQTLVAPHEAIVPAPGERATGHVTTSPPPPIAERPGETPPSQDARWIEGYWDWDPTRGEFAWVTGTWRVPPAGQFWVKGYWRRDDLGWSRVPGFWSARRDASPVGTGTVVSNPVGTTPTANTRVAARPPFAPIDVPPREGMLLPLPTTTTAVTPLPSPPNPEPDLSASVAVTLPVTTATVVVPSIITLADQLAGQAADFERVFGTTARVTPGGGAFLADARVVRGAALGLRQAATAGDSSGTFLAYRALANASRRMVDRVNGIAPGRTGPNIQQIWRMSETTSRIGQALPAR
jgi:hypothetical protein